MNPNYNHTGIEIEVVIGVATEWDEFWSYIGSKANQRWAWYLINRNNGDIIAWESGRRIDKVFKKLLNSVEDIPIKICHTDNWGRTQNYFQKKTNTLLVKIIPGELNVKT